MTMFDKNGKRIPPDQIKKAEEKKEEKQSGKEEKGK